MSDVAKQFWIEHASKTDGAIAVHPNTHWQGYQMWTRRMVQAWTLDRIRAVQPHFKRGVDLGCGFGDWSELFAPLVDELHACDVAPAFVEQTQRRVPSARVTCADVRDFTFPAELDFVYIGAVLLYVDDADALEVLQRIRRAVVPGALVIWRDWCTYGWGRRTTNLRDTFYSVHRTPDDVRRIAELARFRVVEQRAAPSIYGEVMGGRRWQWPMRALWRFASLPWTRTSYSLILRA